EGFEFPHVAQSKALSSVRTSIESQMAEVESICRFSWQDQTRIQHSIARKRRFLFDRLIGVC
ncbi:MAG: hypothetical protein KDN04_23145, partial [Verrucomicrobiae bacterium]|nr:hypothetical protein [Verrucomicrobiae bacterium]